MKKQAYTTEELTRYLLGEATGAELDAFAEAVLDDTELHAQIEEHETALIDNYVRGHLDSSLRVRFEHRQATNPALRQRVAVAKVLLPKLEQQRPPQSVPLSWWQSLVIAWQAQALAFKFASAAAALLFIAGGVWLLNENRRLRGALGELQTAQSAQAQRERQLAEQAEAQRTRNNQLVAELEQLRQQIASATPQSTPAPALFATLTLTASGVSGGATDTPRVTLTAAQQQLRLSLRTLPGKQPRYRATLLTAADSRPVWKAENLKPANRNHSLFTLVVPANQLSADEYVVKVEGISPDGDTFTLLSTNFAIEKR
jgi:hypothetical protein